MHNERLKLEDGILDIVTKMSEGNPGAITVLSEALKNEEQVDPDSALAPLGAIFYLDTFGIYGPRIWMLYKDVCGENINATLGVVRAVQLGIISESQLHTAIDNYGSGLNVKEVLKALKKRLPNFDTGQND